MNEEIEKVLSYDPIAHAEKLAGKSYKEDESVAGLGLMLMQPHIKEMQALMSLTHDTHMGATLDYMKGVFDDMGFKEILRDDISDTGDKYYIYWRSGILLEFDSYGGDDRVNGGKALFNYHGPYDAMLRCSRGSVGEIDGEHVFAGSVDIREGLRHCLDNMSDQGTFLEKWIKPPFMWLLHYEDKRPEDYDYKAITAARIKRLPQEVQDAIAGQDTDEA